MSPRPVDISGLVVVVYPEPFRGLILCLLYRFKDVLVQPFVAYRSNVTRNVRVLLRFPWLDVFNANAPRLGPCFQQPTDVFWAIVNTYYLWRTTPFDDLVQTAHNPQRRQREVNFNAQTVTIEVIQHVQRPEAPTIRKLILHEVY